jgi:hypothetical protein
MAIFKNKISDIFLSISFVLRNAFLTLLKIAVV